MQIESKKFKKVYLEISNICNLQCSFCPVVERDKHVMSLVEIEKALLQIKPHAERVCFHLMGEPLNHPDWVSALKIASNMNVPIEITTNGTLMTRSTMMELLSPALLQINFSLQSFIDNFPKADPKTYFQKILEFVLIAEKKRPDLYINFRFWNLEAGEKQNEVNEYFLKTIEEVFAVSLNRNTDPGFKKSKKIRNRIYAHFDSRFEWPNKKDPIKSTSGTCWGARSQLAIHADGSVVPCCLDKEADVLLGNIKEQTFDQVIQSDPYSRIKRGFENNQLLAELCQKCTFRERFSDQEIIS
jgi:radical SAM protein with 4Fe4S-binding SPASM domain